MPENSVDAVVTDPPYELAFMGRSWDQAGVAFDPATWAEALRVLKPGGHLLAFGGTRTYHRMTCAIEDAGFEVRDCLAWMYGSGFPKSLDVSKAIDRAAGAKREVVAERPASKASVAWREREGRSDRLTPAPITAPATDDAQRWQGWGTALKPAFEPIVLARKPLTGTVAQNVLAHGTGALNVDGSRIGTADGHGGGAKASGGFVSGYERGDGFSASAVGRWPANVVLDEAAAAMLDQASGERTSGKVKPHHRSHGKADDLRYGKFRGDIPLVGYGDTGGASRFFYTAKADAEDRGPENHHPTVKPVSLMAWLVKLVTPPGGVVLDPFAGSGSTLIAARHHGFQAIGIEREAEYVAIIERRFWPETVTVL